MQDCSFGDKTIATLPKERGVLPPGPLVTGRGQHRLICVDSSQASGEAGVLKDTFPQSSGRTALTQSLQAKNGVGGYLISNFREPVCRLWGTRAARLSRCRFGKDAAGMRGDGLALHETTHVPRH